MTTPLSTSWFIGYYAIMGILFLAGGGYLLIAYQSCYQYLNRNAGNERPPGLLRKILKYWLLFTLPCLVLSFIPFSWVELLFSIWSLLMIYLGGLPMVHWQQSSQFIRDEPIHLQDLIRKTGVIMVALSPVIFLLAYLVIKRFTHS